MRPPSEISSPISVGAVMRRDFITVGPLASLDEARETMRLARLRHLLVTDARYLLGVLSYRELLEALLRGEATPRLVAEAMSATPYVVTPSSSLASAASRLWSLDIGCLPVVEPAEGAPPAELLVGVLTVSDLLRAAYAPLLRDGSFATAPQAS